MPKVFKHHPEAILPTRNLSTDAGLDLYALEDVFIPTGYTKTVPTGVSIEVPVGMVGLVMDRSSMGKKGLRVGGGVIDALFAGQISVILHNLNNIEDNDKMPGVSCRFRGYQVKKGDKIAQLVIQHVDTSSVEEVTELWTSERGSLGFGSSGR